MPSFDPLTYRYSSRRNVVYAKKAVACTSVPLGAQIGLDVMKSGGNAVDAAVAMAAAMPLLEPTGNGLGSDCFALVWIEKDQKLYGLNASGVAPMALSADKVRELGFDQVPKEGWLPTMVPGAPAGWAAPSGGPASRPGKTAPPASYNTHWAEKQTPSGPRPSIRYSPPLRQPTIRSSWPRVASLL